MEQNTPHEWVSRYIAEVEVAMSEGGVAASAREVVLDELAAQYHEELAMRGADLAAQWEWLGSRPSPRDFASAYHEHAPLELAAPVVGVSEPASDFKVSGTLALGVALLAAPLAILAGAIISSSGHDGEHVGFLLFIALEVVAIALGLLSWSTRRGKIAAILGIALPTLATILGALGS